jgi:N-formylmaleamate deformylase
MEAEWDVIMPDARARGRSARVQPGEEVDQTADLAGLMRALDLGPAVVAGHSMGAWMASELGARFPEMVRGIVLEDPPWRSPKQRDNAAAPARGRQNPQTQWILEMASITLDDIVARERDLHPTWPYDVLRAWCAAKQQLDVNFFELAGTGRMDWQEVVKALQCPTLVITGDPAEGGIVTPEVAEVARSLNDRIRVVNFAGVGHHVRFAVYGRYMETVKGFLGEL